MGIPDPNEPFDLDLGPFPEDEVQGIKGASLDSPGDIGFTIPQPRAPGGMGAPPPPLPPSNADAIAAHGGIAPPSQGRRDRILILGRRKAGKSVFLARLYERLWNSKDAMHMAAVDGRTHVALLTQISEMSKRRWPAATDGISEFTFDVTYRDEVFSMTAPDYPGEVFRRAFMGGNPNEAAVRELLDNIDRAAAVIVLVDPHVASEGDILTMSEQDFGLVAAIKRIRDSAGAEHVPVAITLTKCDRFREEIESAGGPGKYIRTHYMNLCRVVFRKGSQGTVFACSAVTVKRDGLGNEVPDISKPSRGLIEPLQYCLDALQVGREKVKARARAERTAAKAAEAAREVEKSEQRERMLSTGVLVFTGLFIAVAVLVVVVILSRSGGR